MAEYETIEILNPLKEEVMVRFNGELYKLPAEAKKSYPKFLAFHMAKELSDKILVPELLKLKKADKEKGYNPKNAQLVIYDNPSRRISLYQVLGSKDLVQECVEAFPFKSFIGEMSVYDEYVAKGSKKPSVKEVEETEE